MQFWFEASLNPEKNNNQLIHFKVGTQRGTK